MSLRVAIVGGGPGGLFLASLLRQADPAAEVTVFERNRAEDTFGFGVVFSDATLTAIHDADPVLLDALREAGCHWDRIEVRLKGERRHIGGNGMASIVRTTLLALLQRRAVDLGAKVQFEHEVRSLDELEGHDLVVLADGGNSRLRGQLPDQIQHRFEDAQAKFIWFGTTYRFDGLTFLFERNQHGTFAVHGYPISDSVGTFIVETNEQTWRRAGLDGFDLTTPPGTSDEVTRDYLQTLFAEQIDGAQLLANNSRWGNFRTRRTAKWSSGNVVLIGDAAHTAHFSVGSGTKMAMEDAIALVAAITGRPGDLGAACEDYEQVRRPAVEHIQQAARPSLSWWEHFGRYYEAFAPSQFAFHFMTRSIGRAKWKRRDAAFVSTVDQDWVTRHGAEPLTAPLAVGMHTLAGRTVRIRCLAGCRWLSATGSEGDQIRIPLGGSRDGRGQEWGLWLDAPELESGLPATRAALRAALSDQPCLVAVRGGTPLTRALLAEEVRLLHCLPALLVEDTIDEDRFSTLLLSGRADLVSGGLSGCVAAESSAQWGGTRE